MQDKAKSKAKQSKESKAMQCNARQGKVRPKTRPGQRQGKAKKGKAKGKAKPKVRQGKAMPNERQGKAMPKTRQGKARQGKAKPSKADPSTARLIIRNSFSCVCFYWSQRKFYTARLNLCLWLFHVSSVKLALYFHIGRAGPASVWGLE
jgi:hypothetical protein